MTFFSELRANAWKAGAIAAAVVSMALLAALLLTRASLADVKGERDKANRALGAERQAHAITQKSVDELSAIVVARNQEALRRAAEYEAARVQAAKDAAAADARYAATETRRNMLERLAGQKPGIPCPVPRELTDALEGL
jgi:hypothetical protein